jgi:inosose dehydratase
MMSSTEEIARRKFFLRIAQIASWTWMSHAIARADDAQRTIGLGFSLYGMRSMTIAAALKALADIGYDCIELPVMPDWPADSARLSAEARPELRTELAERGLRLASLMENLPALGDDAQHRANLDRLKRAAELALDLTRDSHTPLIETILGGQPGEFDAVKDRLVERLLDWTKILADAQVMLAIKAHISNATQRAAQLLWLLDQVSSPWLRIAYDYSHFQLQNLDMKETCDLLLPKTVFIHVKDTEHTQGKRGFLLPGEGTIDYVALFKLIAQSTYRGDIIVEVSSHVFNRPGYEPLAAARNCYAHLAAAASGS